MQVGVLLDQLPRREQSALRRAWGDAQQHRGLQGGGCDGVPVIVERFRARRQVAVRERRQPRQRRQHLLLAGLQHPLPLLGVGELPEQHGPLTAGLGSQRSELRLQQTVVIEPVEPVVVYLLELPALLGPGVQLLLGELVEPVRVHATHSIEHPFEWQASVDGNPCVTRLSGHAHAPARRTHRAQRLGSHALP